MSASETSDTPVRDNDTPTDISRETSNDERSSSTNDKFVPPTAVEAQAIQLEDSSQILKKWLVSFEPLKPGTQVSLKFRIEAADYPEESPHSLLPLLTQWLRTWFDRSLSDSQDRSNLSWLLQYTADYLELGHCRLDEPELSELCHVLLYICENARQHSHLEGCLSVFLSIAEIEQFPPDCLEQTIKILSTATVILERPLTRIGSCVKLLARSKLHDATLEALYDQILVLSPTHSGKTQQDVSATLTPARGAARHLSTLLERVESEEPLLDLEKALFVLKDAAERGITRFATEALAFSTRALRSSYLEQVLDSGVLLNLLFDLYATCKASSLIHDIGDTSLSKTKSPQEDLIARERRYRRDHASAVRGFQEAVAWSLLRMPEAEASKSWNLIRESLDDLSAASRVNAIQYVENQGLYLPDSCSDWAQNLFLLLDKVVIGKHAMTDAQIEEQFHADDEDSVVVRALARQRATQRIEIIVLCSKAISEIADERFASSQVESTGLPYFEVGNKALIKLLGMPRIERNLEALKTFFAEMLHLCNVSQSGSQRYASVIISTLENQILTNARDDHTSVETYIRATQCIRDIFILGLTGTSNVSNQAYQSLMRLANCKTSKSQRCRITAMSLLFRLRCDTSGAVYIDTSDDSAYIASALCKTEESLNAMLNENDVASEDLSLRPSLLSARQLWMYPAVADDVCNWPLPDYGALNVKISGSEKSENNLNMSDWLWLITTNLQEDKDWETYSYAIVHLGSQLMNTRLFENSLDMLAGLRGFLCGRVRERKAMFDPPKEIGLDKSDVALCFYHVLTRMIPFYKIQGSNPHYDTGRKGIDLVRAFRAGIVGDVYYGTARSCIHALAICCYETPEAIGSEYPGIIEAMAKTVSTPHVLVHILEFLAQVARLPHLHRHFMEQEIRGIFGICIAALKSLMSTDEHRGPPSIDSKRTSAHTGSTHRSSALHTPFRAAMLKEKGLKQYSCALAYHTMIFWFLSIPIGQRHKYVKEVTKQLVWTDTKGNTTIDEQTVVLIDLMQRTAFSDLSETARDESFSGPDYETSIFMDGNSIVSIETHRTTGRSQITKRQAAGTTHAIYQPHIQVLQSHHDRAFYNELERRGFPDKVQPSHTFINMVATAVPVGLSEQPLKLNTNEPYVGRAIRSIDLKSTVDSHKIAITLLKNNQTEEAEYLKNTTGTRCFDDFLAHIGTRVSLEPPCAFTPFGLIPDMDGPETIAWRDRINEVVFEISTLMPNVDEDPYQSRKKSHMGNCLVLVVFNQSNQKWKWDYFKSQATLVNIVITPANRVSEHEDPDNFEHEHFEVEVLTKEEYQNISAAAETKVVSKSTLAPFVRMLALNANIFSECARNELTGDNEFPSSWRYRMQEIMKLRERTQQRIADDEDTLAKQYDFSRWT